MIIAKRVIYVIYVVFCNLDNSDDDSDEGSSRSPVKQARIGPTRSGGESATIKLGIVPEEAEESQQEPEEDGQTEDEMMEENRRLKEYLEKLQAKQTFYKNPVGNAKVAKSGHVYAKVKFGDFTKEAYDDWRKKGGKPPNNNEEGRSANHWF